MVRTPVLGSRTVALASWKTKTTHRDKLNKSSSSIFTLHFVNSRYIFLVPLFIYSHPLILYKKYYILNIFSYFVSCVKCRIILFIYCFLSHPGFSQLLNLLNLLVWQDIQVTYDVGAVPLVLLFHGPQQETRVPLTILVAAEQTATPCFVLVKHTG